VNVHESALRHGIKPEDSVHAPTHPIWVADLDEDSPQRQLRLGFDPGGRLLETVVLTFDSGNQLIIHAMKARPHMIDLLP
jgi:hypothetical protein